MITLSNWMINLEVMLQFVLKGIHKEADEAMMVV